MFASGNKFLRVEIASFVVSWESEKSIERKESSRSGDLGSRAEKSLPALGSSILQTERQVCVKELESS